ncbi:MAG: 4Fe-4S dicluster domain-containing protein [Bacteroidia bacterium]|nr:4Fe-4S dicluster domain-containing protein [Bacteroidia bacterium]
MSKNKNSRRDFLKLGLLAGGTLVTGSMIKTALSETPENDPGSNIKVLTPDGKLVEISKASIKAGKEYVSPKASHQGIPHRKFVMVIDLSRCKNARKCVEACKVGHHLPSDHEWMKVYLMQDSSKQSPYWFPRPCFHCDSPMCASVCPVGATYKRSDGIVLIDSGRCIGCKFCMTGCPYSVRVFNWKDPEVSEEDKKVKYSPETGIPQVEGTVGKCIFCADLLRKNELPRCVQACPMGVIFFGDIIEDTVTNGTDTIPFSQLVKDRSAFRYLEQLGTEPSVYYLPPTERLFPFESGLDDLDKKVLARYKNTPYMKNQKKLKNDK